MTFTTGHARRGYGVIRFRRAITLALIWASVLIAPRIASAQATFFWTGGNGNWNDAANWLHVNGPVGPGYPSQPEDTASFINDHVPADRTITIPGGVTVTAGVMIFNCTPKITINGALVGPQARTSTTAATLRSSTG